MPATPPAPEEVVRVQPMRHFDPEGVRHAVGAEMQVVIEEAAKAILAAARRVAPARTGVHCAEFRNVLPSAARYETAGAWAPP